MNIKQALVKYKSDGILIHNEFNRKWFLNFESSFGYLLVNKDNKAILIVDSRYYLAAKQSIKKAKVWCLSNKSGEDLVSLVKKAKEELKIKKVLLEEEYTTLDRFRWLTNIWNPNNIASFSSRQLREVKNAEEIKCLQKAADIAVDTIHWVCEIIKPGMSELALSKLISIKMLSLGAEKNSFDPIVAAGINGANPHHHPSDYKIQDGDMVTIDIGCIWKGYASDITRTIVVGNKCNNDEMLTIYKTVYNAQVSAVKKANNKISGVELDKYCRDLIDKTQYKGLFAHGTGHGVGLEVHELPNVNASNKNKFVNNNVVTIEPGIYKSGVGGVRIEDTIVINNNKPIILTKGFPKTLQFVNYKGR